MKKGQTAGKTKDGKTLYFISYSNMKYNGWPLLLCHTDKNAKPRMCAQYTQEYFTK